MNRNDKELDDLTEIKYIGPKLQLWLRDELKVRTYKQLAELSVENIQSRLRDDGMPVAEFKIEAWIEQAEELALEAEEEDEALPAIGEAAGGGASEQTSQPKKAGDWKEYASFMVYFESRKLNGKKEKRIKVSHLEEDKSVVWPELSAPNFSWMLNQAGESPFRDKLQPVKEEQPEPKEAQPIGKAEVKVSQIRLYQPPEAKNPLATSNGKSKKQKLSAGEPFALEVLFSIAGEAAESVVKQGATYSVQIVAKETKTKVGTDLGGSQPEALAKGIFAYSARTPEVTLDPGVHQLWAMVRVRAENTAPNFMEGPLVKVVQSKSSE